jgi:hypothetical protein
MARPGIAPQVVLAAIAGLRSALARSNRPWGESSGARSRPQRRIIGRNTVAPVSRVRERSGAGRRKPRRSRTELARLGANR